MNNIFCSSFIFEKYNIYVFIYFLLKFNFLFFLEINIFTEFWIIFNEILILIFIIICSLLLGLLFIAKVEIFQFINKCLILLLTINFFYFNTFFVLNLFNQILNYSSLNHFLILFGGCFIIIFLYIIAGSKKIIANNSNLEFSILVFFSYLSIILLILINNFIISILTLQCLSLIAYILVGFERYNKYSAMMGIKYLLLGAIPGGLFIFGILDLYTIWGSFNEKDLELLYNNSEFVNILTNISSFNFLQEKYNFINCKNNIYFQNIINLNDDFKISFNLQNYFENDMFIDIYEIYIINVLLNLNTNTLNIYDFIYFKNLIFKNENIGIFFLLVNLLFKITAAPFHAWAPKIYEGAPLISTIFLSIFSKIAIIFYLFHLLFTSFYLLLNNSWLLIFLISIFMSLIIALFGAFGEKRLKKFFVYSSMGHISFIMLGLLTTSLHGMQASIEYLIIYSITSLIAWIILLFLKSSDTHLTNLSGLAIANGNLAIALSVSMLSMAGIPPLAGFFVKLNILYSVIDVSFTMVIAFILILTVFNFYYYLRILKISFFEPIFENKYFNFISINIMQSKILWLNIILINFFIIYNNNSFTEIIEKLISFL